jgi:sarcosine oxidase
VFQPDAGIVVADRAIRAFLAVAVGGGTRVLERTAVDHLSVDGDRVLVRTSSETFRANVAVVTAGPWARGLVAGAGIDLPVAPSLETVAFFPTKDEMKLTIFVDRSEPEHPLYSLPSPGQGLKAGAHHTGPVADPREGGAVDPEIVRRLSEWVADRCPDVQSTASRAETCLYTNTSDERFILERHGPVVVGSACSGHGFKFAPLIGKRLAELAISR